MSKEIIEIQICDLFFSIFFGKPLKFLWAVYSFRKPTYVKQKTTPILLSVFIGFRSSGNSTKLVDIFLYYSRII